MSSDKSYYLQIAVLTSSLYGLYISFSSKERGVVDSILGVSSIASISAIISIMTTNKILKQSGNSGIIDNKSSREKSYTTGDGGTFSFLSDNQIKLVNDYMGKNLSKSDVQIINDLVLNIGITVEQAQLIDSYKINYQVNKNFKITK